jgi:hypothetical protein
MEQNTRSSSIQIIGRNILVLDGDNSHDWVEMFAGKTTADGRSIRVVQASWMETNCNFYDNNGCYVSCAPFRESLNEVKRPQTITFKPDFVIVRNQPRGPTPVQDRRNTLYGLMVANIPSVNSLQSIYLNLERPCMYAQMRTIQDRVGREKFPLVPLNFYSNPESMVINESFPAVVKVSHAHRGMGKMLIHDNEEFRDVATILALHDDYATSEPYIPTEHGIRVQKIGNHYRVLKKVHTGSGWKSHFGGADLQEIELNDTFKLWVDECAKLFGGLDMLAVDAVFGKDGKYYILELNDTAIGFLTHRWKEDTEHVIELVMQKMNEIYCPGMEVKPNEQKPVESPKKQAQPVETKDTTKEGKKEKDKKKEKKEKEKKQ